MIAERGRQRQLIVQAQLPANKDREAYEVWLYNSKGDARSLGAQVTDQQGTFQGAGPLPEDFERYRFIDVSREKVDQERGHSGNSILRGRIDQIQAPPASNTGHGGQGAPAQAPQQQPQGHVALLPTGSSLPGFMIPAGSTRSFAAASTSSPRAPTSRSIQGRGRCRPRGGG